MVKINTTPISRKLKMKRTEKLINDKEKGIFKDLLDSLEITDAPVDMIYVKKKGSNYSDTLLAISLRKNIFYLTNRAYYERVYKLAEEYERLFGTEKIKEPSKSGGEVIIKLKHNKSLDNTLP